MSQSIDRITLRGFKSIEELEEFPVNRLNVLIGANGAGKSNFVDFFRMLRAFADERFQQFVRESGAGDGFFYLGPKRTPKISARLEFGDNSYEFELIPTADGSLQFARERLGFKNYSESISGGTIESVLKASKDQPGLRGGRRGVPFYVYDAVSSWTVYHFHDTSPLAAMRRDQSSRDNITLRPDGSNIAAFLHAIRDNQPGTYRLVRDTVRLMAPFFDDFLLRAQEMGRREQVRLEWRQKGSDFPFQPYQLSDGTIRFVCLATALLQPEPPAAIVIDEPELGLHPYAVSILADLIKSASTRTQVIVSTQSPTLLDYFEPHEIVVVNREKGRSTFERLDGESLREWLDDYSVGELWQKNVVRGGPTGE